MKLFQLQKCTMDEIQLRNLYGPATEKASAKIMKSLDPHSVSFINASNFLVMGTFDGEDIDLSPKGDPKVLLKLYLMIVSK